MNRAAVITTVVLTGGLLLWYFVIQNPQNFFPNQNPQLPTATPQNKDEIYDIASPKEITVFLNEQSNSNESGTATLTEVDDQTLVTLTLTGALQGVSQPAHIHEGSCPNVGEIIYPLSQIVNGRSETMIEATLEQILNQLPLAINVHRSTSQSNIYVACGNLQTK